MREFGTLSRARRHSQTAWRASCELPSEVADFVRSREMIRSSFVASRAGEGQLQAQPLYGAEDALRMCGRSTLAEDGP